jgi:hypothetical protein
MSSPDSRRLVFEPLVLKPGEAYCVFRISDIQGVSVCPIKRLVICMLFM